MINGLRVGSAGNITYGSSEGGCYTTGHFIEVPISSYLANMYNALGTSIVGPSVHIVANPTTYKAPMNDRRRIMRSFHMYVGENLAQNATVTGTARKWGYILINQLT